MKMERVCAGDVCETGFWERPRYYPGQLITAGDLTLGLDYFRNRLRMHNRLLHGWGVVCGALVCPSFTADGTATEPWLIRISAGFILGPYGDEILIDREITIDLRKCGTTGQTGEPCDGVTDPWCSDVYTVPDTTGPLYVAVRYKEAMCRPVKMHATGCGCEDSQCQYSRIRDGFEFGLLTGCPASHVHATGDPATVDWQDLLTGPVRACPACPTEPWVVLARVEVGNDGVVQMIDNCACRRLVVSFASVWWSCQPADISIDSVAVDSTGNLEANKDYTVTIHGKGFKDGARVGFGRGIRVVEVKVDASGKTLTAKIHVEATADIGSHAVWVANADCSTITKAGVFDVGEAVAQSEPSRSVRKSAARGGAKRERH